MSEKMEYQAMKERAGMLLNANESSVNLPLAIREEIAQAVKELSFHRYPQDEASKLCQAYAAYVGVKETQVIAGNGSDEMLGLIIGMHVPAQGVLYTLTPDFSMYDYYAGMYGGKVERYYKNWDSTFDVEDFIAKGKAAKADLVLFSNPNNPTGQIIPKQALCRIVQAFDCPVVIDEAYGEFARESMIDQLDRYPHLYVTRTLSKTFAFAGGRCGFLLGNQEAIAKRRPYKVPYNVNALTQCAAQIVLSHKEELLSQCELIKQERSQMIQECGERNNDLLTIYPSSANFLYGRCQKKQELLDAFAKAGITIRNYGDDSFRITIGMPWENEAVLAVLRGFWEEYK